MRMVRTQARDTKKFIKKAQKILIDAIRNKNFFNLQLRLEQELRLLPDQAMILIRSLAEYEAQFTSRALKREKKDKDVVLLSATAAVALVSQIKIKPSLNKPAAPIEQTYKSFVAAKVNDLVQLVRDIEVDDLDDEDAEDLVNERVDGLFTTQNLALAGLAIMGTANSIRNEVADLNDMQVEWSLDLELNNCPYCEDMADDSPYDPDEVDGLIPAHANCGCTLVPVDGDGSVEED